MQIKYPTILVLGLFITLAGCTRTLGPAIDSYTIQSQCNSVEKSKKPGKLILKIRQPRSIASIKSHNILYQDKALAQNPYAFSRWNDTPNRMLGDLFQSCIDAGKQFTATLPSASTGKANWLLESQIVEFFHHITSNNSEGRIRVKFHLIEAKTSKVIATTEISIVVQAEAINARGGVKALNKASQIISKKLVSWLQGIN